MDYISRQLESDMNEAIQEDFDEAHQNLYGDVDVIHEDCDSQDCSACNQRGWCGEDFADPGGNSALRADTKKNPRNLPCPTCKQPNRLTPADRKRGYQCDQCADRTEQGLDLY